MIKSDYDKERYENIKNDPIKWEKLKKKQREYHNINREARNRRARELYSLKTKEQKIKKYEQVKNYKDSKGFLIGKYSTYKSSAKKRGYSFLITKKQFSELINSNCSYCGSKEDIGIDRINNNVGYEIDNCTSCCSICNRMKYIYSIQTFLNHCQKIINYNK